MRRSTLPLLLIVVIPLVALGCGRENPYCYATDATGVVRDSVRPDPGYVCVASAVGSPPAGDSVRPDTSVTVQVRSALRADLP